MDGGFIHDGRAAARRRKAGTRAERMASAKGVLDGILSQLRPGDLCLDCGANVGSVAGPLAETGAEVLAFEPDPVAFAALSDRLAPFANAHPVQAAVDVSGGTATLHRSNKFADDPLGATISSTVLAGKRDSDGQNDISVRVLSLPDMLETIQAGRWPDILPMPTCAPSRIALLKMDVEGAELTLLPALHHHDLLTPIACTVVETHQRKFPALRQDFLSMRRQIAGLYPGHKVNLDWI